MRHWLTAVGYQAFGIPLQNDLFSNKQLMGIEPFGVPGQSFVLHQEALAAFNDMCSDAKKEGLYLWITSGYRTFVNQKYLWNKKVGSLINTGYALEQAVQKTLIYSAIPGTSRHHWGTDVDITDALGYENTDPLDPTHYLPGGDYQFLNYWLENHAHKYSFYMAYTPDSSRSGFKYEAWHYSYAPLAKIILQQVLDIDFTVFAEMRGCKGYEYMSNHFFKQYKKEYLLGINPLLI